MMGSSIVIFPRSFFSFGEVQDMLMAVSSIRNMKRMLMCVRIVLWKICAFMVAKERIYSRLRKYLHGIVCLGRDLVCINFSLLSIAICADLTSSSSFSLAERIQASLILARSCVSCTNFSLLRSLKIGFASEKTKYLPR